jgi:hypothetical protein
MNMDEKVNNERTFEYGKNYYFDNSGISISEQELSSLKSDCSSIVQACCRLQIPRGFKVSNYNPAMCFNLSNLTCVKNPIVKKVELPSCDHKHPTECEVVTGYEIKAVGEVEFSVSVPICPIKGYCICKHSNACCNTIVPVNKIISYSCCPKQCSKDPSCIDWRFCYFCINVKQDNCGQYLEINVGVALEYAAPDDCDEE